MNDRARGIADEIAADLTIFVADRTDQRVRVDASAPVISSIIDAVAVAIEKRIGSGANGNA